ncbi:MAG: hypothetical protein KAS32_06975 [Candidatus Peribacteraceae bacterium]|nr:hypothetical protein [Candidatus Peribacteraceae bacterium]
MIHDFDADDLITMCKDLCNPHVNEEKWHDWVRERKIPELNFPSDWSVRVLPSFMGAAARFHIDNDTISVYLDLDSSCGIYKDNEPYWEVNDFKSETIYRFGVDDVEGLFACIEECRGKNKDEQ